MKETLKVASFLAYRQLKRGSRAQTLLIIFVMTLTFLNLVVVSGILVGLIAGSERAYRENYIGDLVVVKKKTKEDIAGSSQIIDTLKSLPEVKTFAPRLVVGASLEANYRSRDLNEAANEIGASVAGVLFDAEAETIGLNSMIVEGRYLRPGEGDGVLVGSNLLEQYSVVPDQLPLLKNVSVGDRILIKIGETQKEYFVRGVIKTKVDDITFKVFMDQGELRKLLGKNNFDVSEIAVVLKNPDDDRYVQGLLRANGYDQEADIKVFEEGVPKFLVDIKKTFALLGNAISSIGLVVAAITLFIVIFINALTRRKYIGILKAIGVKERAIELAYVFQSLFYATLGSLIGLILVYGLIRPAFDRHPIDFPFSDGILVAPLESVLLKVALLVVVTAIAGYIPAKLIVRKNTLDSILGR